MGVFVKPVSSSATRIAPTMPSIMPLGCDHVGARLGVDYGLASQQGERGVVIDVDAAAARDERTAMSVIGILAEAQVGDNEEVRRGFAEGADCPGNDAVGTEGFAPAGVFLLRNSEEDDSAEAQGRGLLGFFVEHVGRELEIPRHGFDFAAKAFAVADEEGEDEILGQKVCPPDEPPHARVRPQTPHPHGRKGGGRCKVAGRLGRFVRHVGPSVFVMKGWFLFARFGLDADSEVSADRVESTIERSFIRADSPSLSGLLPQ